MKAHKFIKMGDPSTRYHWGMICEYCGFVAFYANDSDRKVRERESQVGKPCPLAQDKLEANP